MSAIPDDAVEVVQETWDTGGKKIAHYFVDGEQVGCRYWEPSGVLVLEYGVRQGKMHGQFRRWHDNGKLCEEGCYYDGSEHGEIKQYDHEGRLIGSYIMDHGTGTDLWYCAPGVLSEEREYREGERHGYERWWDGDNQTVYEESHFYNGIAHGIFRQWNQQGKLRRGYPQYYVMGQRVIKRQYERACRDDATLPPFVGSDNQPVRQLPAAVLEKRKDRF